ncbi:COX15/CtaA family protein [Propionivibrio sp.]|uniref:COX15/CtaA family protein n=1 Tax=Propionivibrio sp. TaxID=2212460 RepID=UPI0039E5DD59
MRLYRALLLAATLLALGVISLGAYVRLSDAGLGCPDWPGCYGHLLGVPDTAHEHAAAQQAFPGSPVETHKAWKEMTHRYFAGTLGLLIAAIAVLAWRQRRTPGRSPWIATGLIGIVGLQALLGMWTVTLLLRPVVVTAHLLGGMTTLALLVWLLLASGAAAKVESPGGTAALRLHAALALLAVVVQIALGGWVSSNYAALICNDFPTCLGTWVPDMDFATAFSLHRELGRTGAGDFLPGAALVAIQWSHRLGALVVAALAGTLAWRLWRSPARRAWGIWLGLSLAAQIALGIANVLLFLPLHLAVAHNLGAAVLLAVVLALNIALAAGEAGAPAR